MHAQKNKIPPMIPSDKPILGPAPISNNFTPQPILPPVIRQEFTPVPAPQPVVHPTITPNPPPLFAGIGKNRFMLPYKIRENVGGKHFFGLQKFQKFDKHL